MLDAALVIPKAPLIGFAGLPEPSGGPRPGFAEDIFHPPR
jgi:hypothetical protein